MIEINDYFTEVTDEGRGTIGYSLIPWKGTALVKAIYKQNNKFEKIKRYINEQLMRGVDKFEPKVLYRISKIIEEK